MEGILGKKVGMTQFFMDKGECVPVSVIEAGPCFIVQKKTVDKDGYEAIQVGFIEKKNVSKPLSGHFEKAKINPQRFLKELSVEKIDDYEVGKEIKVDIFKQGDYVDITGISKGKGFAGVMKRWGFAGGPASHGAHKSHRRGGSIGQSAAPSRVFKGKKMSGRMGTKQVTVQNLKVVKVETEKDLLMVKGAIPGPRKGLLVIRKAVKKNKGSEDRYEGI